MTESHDRTERIDLRALAPESAESERVIGAVMARLASRPQLSAVPTNDRLAIVGRYLAPAWIAAAAAVAIACSVAVVSSTDDQPAPVDAMVTMWADQQHIPTNGELLLAFQGYRR